MLSTAAAEEGGGGGGAVSSSRWSNRGGLSAAGRSNLKYLRICRSAAAAYSRDRGLLRFCHVIPLNLPSFTWPWSKLGSAQHSSTRRCGDVARRDEARIFISTSRELVEFLFFASWFFPVLLPQLVGYTFSTEACAALTELLLLLLQQQLHSCRCRRLLSAAVVIVGGHFNVAKSDDRNANAAEIENASMDAADVALAASARINEMEMARKRHSRAHTTNCSACSQPRPPQLLLLYAIPALPLPLGLLLLDIVLPGSSSSDYTASRGRGKEKSRS